MAKTATAVLRRERIRRRVRKNVKGNATRPRLTVFRSNKDIYAQLVDDVNGVTLAAANSRQKDFAGQKGTKSEKATLVGKAIAQKAISLGIETCVFDRSGFLYHGRIKSLADGAREGGLKF